MKKKRFSVEQIVSVLKQAELGVPVAEVIRKVGISEQTFYRWKKQNVGMETNLMPVLKRDCNVEGRGQSGLQKLFRLQIDLFSMGEEVCSEAESSTTGGPDPGPSSSSCKCSDYGSGRGTIQSQKSKRLSG